MKIETFEDILAWQKAQDLVLLNYKEFKNLRDFSFKDQLLRACVSIMNNIAEGFERGSASEFHRFLTIAKASSAELRSQLYVALDVGYMSQETFSQLMKSSEEVSNIIGGLRVSVGKRKTN